jgi:hypothetical protein
MINRIAVAIWSRHLGSLVRSDGSSILVVVWAIVKCTYRPEMRWAKSREVIKIPATSADDLSPIQHSV